ncbi:MAG TPA: hypothetical protein PLK99_08740 [Burkholderiales bacterium]|nr:hypothetical protein [Burkholderiales bacterium]
MLLLSKSLSASSLSDFLEKASQTQEMQPHWASMLGVSSTGLTQGFRYHYTTQDFDNGTQVRNYGSNKGLELILSERFQVQIGVPAYIEKDSPKVRTSGWGDEALLGKYRFLSANEENGNYVVSGSLGLSLPSGSTGFTSRSAIFTPVLAAGKGWGTRQREIAIQSRVSFSVPDRNLSGLGMPVSWNTGLQARTFRHFWPEIEAIYTHWRKGPYDGKNQLLVTYGVVFDYRIMEREKLSLGIGYQEPKGTSPTALSRKWISMMKIAF